MRFACLAGVCFALTSACGQKIDHPDAAPPCDPATTQCDVHVPNMGGGLPAPSNQGGEGSGGGEEELVTLTGQVVAYADDSFDQASTFPAKADVSAVGEGGARVASVYDGTQFQLMDVLKASANWFLVEPAASTGMLPTLTPVDTRTASSGYLLGVASSVNIDRIFLNLGTDRSGERAQVVLHVMDAQGRPVSGVRAELTAEKIAYRTAGTWVANDDGTDGSGLIFFGNVPSGTALAPLVVTLSGAATARVEVSVRTGAVTVASALVSAK
jgi:hypothetical protein